MKSIFVLVLGMLISGGGAGNLGWDKVAVEGGYISGGVNGTGDVHFFKGIPFAAPPVGALRWKEPQPVAVWSGVRACVQPGPSPMQSKPVPFMCWSEEYLIPEKSISEDCLYLNIWTGARVAKERRPVLVFIYGGGFGSGGGNVPIYDGEAMAKKGVIFVTINYRVGIFGFLSHPELTKESGHQASGNYGLMDQIAALKWIQKNIAAFGGDPDNVTIAGQSAGSMSVNCLVVSPLAKGLFERAIGESGANFSRENVSLAQAEAAGVEIGKKLGAGTGAGSMGAGSAAAGSLAAGSLAALRGLSAAELQEKAEKVEGSWRPVVDGYVVPGVIADIFVTRKENPVGLLTGWNGDEDNMLFGRQNYAWANLASANGEKVFVYRFRRVPPTAPGGKLWGSFHTAEVPYAYNNLRFVKRPWEPVDYNLSDAMSSYWVNFAKTGDPNGVGLAVWEPYSREGGKIMLFDKQPVAGILPDKGVLDSLYTKMNLP